MSYTKTTWVNNQAPAINADNLNHMEQGIESAHNQIDINTSDIDSLETQTQNNTQNIATETSARQSQDSLLQSQIDQLVAPTGEAPNPSEIENARIGDDGVTYDTLGNAIRGQFSDVKSALTAVSNQPTLKWNIKQGISASGAISSNNYTALTDIIPAQAGDRIVYTGAVKDANNNGFVNNIATYKSVNSENDTFVERLTLYGTPRTLGADITGYRLHFGRAQATGVIIQESDISTYYSVEVYQKFATDVEFEKLSETVRELSETKTGTIGAMTAIAETYLNQAYSADNQIVYESGYGIYTNPVNEQGKKATVCSQFMKSLLMGTPYEYSRYVQDENSASWWSYEYDSSTDAHFIADGRGVLASDQVAKYCDDKGWLVPFDSAHNNIRAGDVIFWSDENRDDKYLKVVHCAICLYVCTDGCYIIHAGSNKPRPIDGEDVGMEVYHVIWNSYTPSYYARLPLIAGNYTNQLILEDTKAHSGTYSGTSVSMSNYVFDGLPIGIYSLLWEDDGNGISYVKLNPNGINVNIQPCKQGNKYYVVFYATEPIVQIDMRSYQGTTYDLKSARLYKGYKVQGF